MLVLYKQSCNVYLEIIVLILALKSKTARIYNLSSQANMKRNLSTFDSFCHVPLKRRRKVWPFNQKNEHDKQQTTFKQKHKSEISRNGAREISTKDQGCQTESLMFDKRNKNDYSANCDTPIAIDSHINTKLTHYNCNNHDIKQLFNRLESRNEKCVSIEVGDKDFVNFSLYNLKRCIPWFTNQEIYDKDKNFYQIKNEIICFDNVKWNCCDLQLLIQVSPRKRNSFGQRKRRFNNYLIDGKWEISDTRFCSLMECDDFFLKMIKKTGYLTKQKVKVLQCLRAILCKTEFFQFVQQSKWMDTTIYKLDLKQPRVTHVCNGRRKEEMNIIVKNVRIV